MTEFSLKNVSLTVDGFEVCRDISLDLNQKDILIITGANGIGKTTLLKQILSHQPPFFFLPKDSTVFYLGVDSNGLLDFTVKENFHFFLSLYGKQKNSFTPPLLSNSLKDKLHSPLSQLSTGQRKLVLLSIIKLIQPNLVLLDEPTLGLDEQHRSQFLSELSSLGKALIIATHESDLIQKATKRIHLHKAVQVNKKEALLSRLSEAF